MTRLFVFLQYLLPRFWLTALVYRIARIRNVAIKDFLITRFVALYGVEVDDVELDVPGDFETFNDFFTRQLADNARPIDASADSIVSPVDGTISSAGQIRGHSIFQAKGLDYSLEDLLATDMQEAQRYVGGTYATIYLAPYDYHRRHLSFSVTATTPSAGLYRPEHRWEFDAGVEWKTAHDESE